MRASSSTFFLLCSVALTSSATLFAKANPILRISSVDDNKFYDGVTLKDLHDADVKFKRFQKSDNQPGTMSFIFMVQDDTYGGTYAKSPTHEDADVFPDEIKATRWVTQNNPDEVAHFIAAGRDSNPDNAFKQYDWLVTAPAKGKPLKDTSAMKTAVAAGKEACLGQAQTAAKSVMETVRALLKTSNVYHGDAWNDANVFFSDDLQKAILIDFGVSTMGVKEIPEKDSKVIDDRVKLMSEKPCAGLPSFGPSLLGMNEPNSWLALQLEYYQSFLYF